VAKKAAGRGAAPGAKAARGGAKKGGRAPNGAPIRLPDPSWDAPLHELGRDALSVFLYVALLPEETGRVVKSLGLSQPGFRQEALGDIQRCDLIADEIRAVPERRAAIIEALRAGLERPVLADWPLTREPAVDLLDACVLGDGAAALALWRALCDPDPEVRAQATPFLERLAKQYYGPAPAGGSAKARGEAETDPLETAKREAQELARRLEDAQRRLEHAEARAESQRKKGEEAREKLQAWLKEARAREAQAVDDAARARDASEAARRDLSRVESELAAARAQDAAVEAARSRGQARDLEARANALEARLARAGERERELEEKVARLESAAHGLAAVPREPAPAAEEGEVEDAPATWLMPVYTREFYDSLEGWDRRVQRAAFKQAALLAQDHRHGSLRALPLEGLPGYYRVRVATDVRLLYRRTERQNTIEILSLIDREDLDRYIKQAKTR
jgi:hypothetical protein